MDTLGCVRASHSSTAYLQKGHRIGQSQNGDGHGNNGKYIYGRMAA